MSFRHDISRTVESQVRCLLYMIAIMCEDHYLKFFGFIKRVDKR